MELMRQPVCKVSWWHSLIRENVSHWLIYRLVLSSIVEPTKDSFSVILITTECSLEAVHCPLLGLFKCYKNQQVFVCLLGGQPHHRPVKQTGPQQNSFITVNNVSLMMDSVRTGLIIRGCFLVGGCASEAQHENSFEPPHQHAIVCYFSKNVKPPPLPLLFPSFLFIFCLALAVASIGCTHTS